MKDKINTQANNDVKEMLAEYVVLPVEDKIGVHLKNTEEIVNSMSKKIDSFDSFGGRLSSISEKINTESETLTSIEDRVEDLFSMVEDKTGNISKDIEKEKNHIINDLSVGFNKIEENNNEICDRIDISSEILNNLIVTSNNIESQIGELSTQNLNLNENEQKTINEIVYSIEKKHKNILTINAIIILFNVILLILIIVILVKI